MTWTDINIRSISAAAVLVLALAMQAWFNNHARSGWQPETQAAPAPQRQWLQLASLNERRAAAVAATLYVQSFDAQAGHSVPMNQLDLERLQQWLALASELKPQLAYPSFLTSRFLVERADPALSRQMLDWILERHRISPAAHWPALAHAVQLARHQLGDNALARKLAAGLSQTDPAIRLPDWARQMQAFLQRDSDELEEARALVGGLITDANMNDPRAIAVLMQDLREIERRLSTDKGAQQSAQNADIDCSSRQSAKYGVRPNHHGVIHEKYTLPNQCNTALNQ